MITGGGNIEIVELPLNSLAVTAISGIVGLFLCWGILLIAKMFGHLSLHRALQQLLGQLH